MAEDQDHGKFRNGVVLTSQSYVRKYVKLYPTNGSFVDIKDLVGNINFSEALDQASVICTLDILDGIDMLETLKINGSEKIEISIQQKTPLGQTNKINKTFYVSDVINHSRSRPGVQTYQLVCISEMTYLNSFLRIKDKFAGSPGNLIQTILKSRLGVSDDDIYNINTDSGAVLKGVYPNLRPLNAIHWLCRNAFEDSTPFYFFDTLQKGIIFDSLKSLVGDEEPEITYEQRPFFKNYTNDVEEFEDSRKRIRKISSDLGMSKYNQGADGTYASTLTSIDISTKEVIEDEPYQYKDNFLIKKHGKKNANAPFPKDKTFLSRTLENFTDARKFHLSLNSLAFGAGTNNYHNHISKFIQKSESIKNGFDFINLNMDVNGDFRLHSGMLVNVKIGKATAKEIAFRNGNTDELDNNLSGNYIVYAINHDFGSKEYVMDVLLKKDSSAIDLNEEVQYA